MRPLPVEPAQSGTLPFVLGLAIIRGQRVSVIDLGILTGRRDHATTGRFVLLRSDQQMAALAVNQVLGVFPIDHAIIGKLPPVLDAAAAASIAETGVVEEQLLGALQSMKVLSEADLATCELSGETA